MKRGINPRQARQADSGPSRLSQIKEPKRRMPALSLSRTQNGRELVDRDLGAAEVPSVTFASAPASGPSSRESLIFEKVSWFPIVDT